MDARHHWHPVVAHWFDQTFPNGPTPPQARAWPVIPEGDDVLVASPTGTRYDVDGLLDGHQRDVLQQRARRCRGTVGALYSPLRALASDVRENLQRPLEQLRHCAEELDHVVPDLRVEIRTGDTSAAERAAHLRRPPHMYVTTPIRCTCR
jgi:ATP-dependent Lhr-like helicase